MNNHAGVIVENAERIVLICNSKFCEIFGIPYKPESIIGTDCSQSAHLVKHMFANPEEFVKDIDIILKKRKPVINETIIFADGRQMRRDYIPIFSGDKYIGHTWQYHLND